MKKLNATAIIAARQNSKGIKNKNLQTINGKTLVEIQIEQGLRTCKNVIVTSDSKEILKIAKRYDNVEAIARDQNLAKDTTPKIPVLQDAIRKYEHKGNNCYDVIFDLQPTSPFRKDESIFQSYELFTNSNNPSNLVSINLTSKHPSYNLVKFKNNQEIELLSPVSTPITGRNLLPDTYEMNGCVFIWNKSALLNNNQNNVITDSTVGFKVNEIEAIDIDNLQDLDFARYIIKKLGG